MKGRLLFFVALLSTACSVIEIEESTSLQKEAIRETLRLKSADSLFYHVQTGMYITLNSNAMSLFMNTAETSESPTHMAVKFFPKSKEEQNYLSKLDDISVSYIPFGYDAVKADCYSKADLQSVPIFVESNPHTISVSDDCEIDSMDGNETHLSNEFVTISLPVMYAVWPVGMPLPTDIEYQIVYRFTMPESDRAVKPVPNYPVQFFSYDSLLCQYIPLRNLRVVVSYGGVSASFYTDSTGLAVVNPSIYTAVGHLSDVGVYYALSTPKWTISRNHSVGPIMGYLGTIGNIWFNQTNPATFCVFCTSESSEFEVHRALDYYFNSTHELSDSVSPLEVPVTVHSCTYTDSEHPTWAAVTWGLSKYIEVYDYPCSQNITLCNVFHELGHVRQCWHHPVEFADTLLMPNFFRESYAAFVGWSIGWSYYQSKGFTGTPDTQQISWDDRQTWIRSSGSNYSPLLVDLNDRLNQWMWNHNYVYDVIQDVPLDFIDRAGLESLAFDDFAQYLRSHSGTYYTLSEINTYLENYE